MGDRALPFFQAISAFFDPATGGHAIYALDSLGRIWERVPGAVADGVDPWTQIPGPRSLVDATLPNDTRPSAPPVIAGPSPTIIVDASLSPTVPAVHVRAWNRDRTDWDCRPECWCRQ